VIPPFQATGRATRQQPSARRTPRHVKIRINNLQIFYAKTVASFRGNDANSCAPHPVLEGRRHTTFDRFSHLIDRDPKKEKPDSNRSAISSRLSDGQRLESFSHREKWKASQVLFWHLNQGG
jgi:hypothetical protein